MDTTCPSYGNQKATQRPPKCHKRSQKTLKVPTLVTKRTPKGYQKATKRSLKGHQKDTKRTPKEHQKDTKRTPKGHQKDTKREGLKLQRPQKLQTTRLHNKSVDFLNVFEPRLFKVQLINIITCYGDMGMYTSRISVFRNALSFPIDSGFF